MDLEDTEQKAIIAAFLDGLGDADQEAGQLSAKNVGSCTNLVARDLNIHVPSIIIMTSPLYAQPAQAVD